MYPAELENLLIRLPDVIEAGVFGVPEPSVQELVYVAVVKKKGSSLSEQEIKEHVNKQVEDYKKIRGKVYFVEKLPRNLQGKIVRRRLREVIADTMN